MPHPSDVELRVLHDLRLEGFAPVGGVASRLDLSEGEVGALIQRFAHDGLAVHRGSEAGGWTLTAAGRAVDEARLAAELDSSGARATVDDLYRRFTLLNGSFLELCTEWQLRPVDPDVDPARRGEADLRLNDHADPTYDAVVVARLGALDDRAQPICAELAATLERFAGYGPRLARARRNVEAGRREWFDRPTVDSYHSTWFELHEDLLSTLGLERGAALAGSPADEEA